MSDLFQTRTQKRAEMKERIAEAQQTLADLDAKLWNDEEIMPLGGIVSSDNGDFAEWAVAVRPALIALRKQHLAILKSIEDLDSALKAHVQLSDAAGKAIYESHSLWSSPTSEELDSYDEEQLARFEEFDSLRQSLRKFVDA